MGQRRAIAEPHRNARLILIVVGVVILFRGGVLLGVLAIIVGVPLGGLSIF